MAWWLSAAAAQWRAEVNARWPGRDKTSDGTIGDARHSATVSDHNPRPDGEVCALDIDVDGIDAVWLTEHFRSLGAGGDARCKYVIYNRRIASRTAGWAWRPYSGVNPHVGHAHFSFNPHATATPGFGIADAIPTNYPPQGSPVPSTGDDDMRYPPTIEKGAKGQYVQNLQGLLMGAKRGPAGLVGRDGLPDGDFGPGTDRVLREWQAAAGLLADGICGPRTWSALIGA